MLDIYSEGSYPSSYISHIIHINQMSMLVHDIWRKCKVDKVRSWSTFSFRFEVIAVNALAMRIYFRGVIDSL